MGNSAELLYAAAGSSEDYYKDTLGVKYSYTVELRPSFGLFGSGFDLPPTEIIPSGQEFMAFLKALLHKA